MPDRLLAGLVAVPFLLGAATAPADDATVVFSFQDNAIIESSGLALVDRLVVTTNDSGDSGRVFSVDPATGETVGVTGWGNDPTDVEALAPLDDNDVWVGDIGDNTESRESIQVAPVPVGRGNKDVDGPIYDLVYPDGPHDAETLLADPTTGRLYIVTKGVFGGRLYAAPETLDPGGPNQLEPLEDVLAIATDGSFFPDGQHLVIRNYSTAVVYAFPSMKRLGSIDLPSQEQGEGIAVDAQDRLLLSSEGAHSEVLRVTLPADIRAALAPVDSQAASGPPSPSTESREDSELPEITQSQRPEWRWLLSGLVGIAIIVVLIRSLRRH